MSDETTQQGVSQAELGSALAEGITFGDEPQHEETWDEAEGGAEAVEQDGADEGGDGEGSEADVSTLDELIEAIGWDREKALGLKTKLKIDGEEHETTLADLIKVHQLEGHVNKKSIELSEQRKAFEAERQQQVQEWSEKVAFTSHVLDQNEAQLQHQFNQIDWDGLYQQDPAHYAALQARFGQAHQMIQSQKQGLAQHYQQTQQQLRESLRPKAREAIKAAFPELADEAAFTNALSEVKSYLKSIGGSEKGMEALEMDPVVFRVARDAAAYHKATQSRAQVEKRVREAPKVVKPGPKLETNTKGAQRRAALDRVKQSGDVSDLGRLLAIDL